MQFSKANIMNNLNQNNKLEPSFTGGPIFSTILFLEYTLSTSWNDDNLIFC